MDLYAICYVQTVLYSIVWTPLAWLSLHGDLYIAWQKASHAPEWSPINCLKPTQIAKFIGPTWGPPGSCRPHMGPMLAPWTLQSGHGNTIRQRRVPGKALSTIHQYHIQGRCVIKSKHVLPICELALMTQEKLHLKTEALVHFTVQLERITTSARHDWYNSWSMSRIYVCPLYV